MTNMLDFITNLYRKNPHPLAQQSGVTQFLEELPADNPAMALVELTHRLFALSNTEKVNLKERVKRLARIDQSAQKYEHALRRRYAETSRMRKATEARIWNASFNFLEALINAQLHCIASLPQKGEHNDQDLAIALMRAIRLLDLQAHWLHLRYRPISLALWERIFSVIKVAEERALLHLPLTLNHTKVQTTVAQEMLKLLMMSVASPAHLTKTRIDLAHLLTQHLAGAFCWEVLPNGSTVFHVDFSKPRTPAQLAKVSERPFMSRCFSAGEAIGALAVGLKQLEQGSVPTSLGAIDFSNYQPDDLLAVAAHLSQCWGKMDVHNEQLHFDMHPAKQAQAFYRITVAHGLNFLYEHFTPTLQSTLTPSTHHARDETESWVVENISQMGYGVTLASLKEDWVQNHVVIGIQPDAAPWQIGVIRSVTSASAGNTHAGIQILSNQPHTALLRPLDSEMTIEETAADPQPYPHTPGIFMHREPPYQNEESILLASGSYQLHRTYAMAIGEVERFIRLQDRSNAFQGVDQIIFTDVKS